MSKTWQLVKERPICWVLGKWFSPQPNIGDVNLDNLGQASQDERRNVGSPPLLADLSLLTVEWRGLLVLAESSTTARSLPLRSLAPGHAVCPALSSRENENLSLLPPPNLRITNVIYLLSLGILTSDVLLWLICILSIYLKSAVLALGLPVSMRSSNSDLVIQAGVGGADNTYLQALQTEDIFSVPSCQYSRHQATTQYQNLIREQQWKYENIFHWFYTYSSSFEAWVQF